MNVYNLNEVEITDKSVQFKLTAKDDKFATLLCKAPWHIKSKHNNSFYLKRHDYYEVCKGVFCGSDFRTLTLSIDNDKVHLTDYSSQSIE